MQSTKPIDQSVNDIVNYSASRPLDWLSLESPGMWWTNKDFVPTPPHQHRTLDIYEVELRLHTPPNFNFLKPKKSTKLNKLHFWKRINKYVGNLIICPTINKGDNLLLDQLSQIMAMKFNMLHPTLCNRIVNNLDFTLIVKMKNIQGFDWKLDLTQELSNSNILICNINNTMVLYFSCRQRDNLHLIFDHHHHCPSQIRCSRPTSQCFDNTWYQNERYPSNSRQCALYPSNDSLQDPAWSETPHLMQRRYSSDFESDKSYFWLTDDTRLHWPKETHNPSSTSFLTYKK